MKHTVWRAYIKNTNINDIFVFDQFFLVRVYWGAANYARVFTADYLSGFMHTRAYSLQLWFYPPGRLDNLICS